MQQRDARGADRRRACAGRASADAARLAARASLGDRVTTIRGGNSASHVPVQDTEIDAACSEIHSDLARRFIRAEVIRWDRLLEAGSEAAAKKHGWMRQEGNSYIVADGDVLHVLFNI